MPALAQLPQSQEPAPVAPRAAIDPLAVYNVSEAASLLNVCKNTITARIRERKINAQGYQPRILGQSLIDYLRG